MINDSTDELLPGDVELYTSWELARKEYELWFADEPHLVIDDTGQTFKIHINGKKQLTLISTGNTMQIDKFREFIQRACSGTPFEIAAASITTFEEAKKLMLRFVGSGA